MATLYEYLTDQSNGAIGASWRWFSALNREEWIVVLAVTCVLGFLCMRGYGSRSNF